MIGFLLTIDWILRLYGLGFSVFFRNRWSYLDIVTTIGIQATTVPLLYYGRDLWKLGWTGYQFQKVSTSSDEAVCLADTPLNSSFL
jgi:hypothetical protein